MNRKKQCQAHVDTTNSRCSKFALRGTKYCWWHQSKGLFFLSLATGAVLSLAVSEMWRCLIPTKEQKLILSLQQEIQQIKRKPEFQPFINGLAVNEFTDINFPSTLGIRTVKQASIVIPTINDQQKIGLVIRNVGNLPADRLMVFIKFPSELSVNIGSGWKPIGFLERTEKGMQNQTGVSYYIESTNVIDPGAYFCCDSIIIDSNVTKPFIVPLDVEISSLQAEKQRFNFMIEFVYGSGEPFISKPRK